MFLKNKEALLIRDVLNLLDNNDEFSTITKIAEQLSYPSLSSVKKICHYLRDKIGELYSPEEIEFTINKRDGVKMERKTVNLQALQQALREENTSYNIVMNIFMDRYFSTWNYYEDHFISKSTLVRRVKKINNLFKLYGLKISASDQIKLMGDESKVRVYHYAFLFSNYKTLTDFLSSQEATPYLIRSGQIFNYLNLPLTEVKFEPLAIWLFVNQHAIENNYLLEEDNELLSFFDHYEFIEKPPFLTDWTENDWRLFLLFLYSLAYLPLEEAVQVKEPNIFTKEINQWTLCFEKIISL